MRTWVNEKCSAVQSKGPEDFWGGISACLDAAKERRSHLGGTAVDLKKCFAPRHLAIKVLFEIDADRELTTALEAFYASMQRRIRIGSALGEAFTSQSCVIQADPLAMLLLNGISSCFSLLLQGETAGTADGSADGRGAWQPPDTSARKEVDPGHTSYLAHSVGGVRSNR